MKGQYRYALQGTVLLFVYALFRLLPLDVASAIGGRLARSIGPFTRAHRTARDNIRQAFPGWSGRERAKTIRAMWDNLGRTIAEYPHLSTDRMARRITIEGREHLRQIQGESSGALFVSGHFANWEIAPLTVALCGTPLVLIYRAANNPVADRLIRRIRARYNRRMHGKGRRGAQEVIKALKSGESVGMLIDQKMNDGTPVPFFGRPAMTSTGAAGLAIRQKVPLIPIRVVRTDGAHFHVTFLPPRRHEESADPLEVTAEMHRLFEEWIRARPGQWFWVHNRWGTAKR